MTPERYDASATRLETSAAGGETWWHAHASIVVVATRFRERSRVTKTEVKELHAAWQGALRREWDARGWGALDAGGMCHVETPLRGIIGIAKEVAKYAVKGSDFSLLDDDELDAATLALDGRRLTRCWGVLRGWHRATKEARSIGLDLVVATSTDETFDPDDGEEAAQLARQKGARLIGRTADGATVAAKDAHWRPLDKARAFRVWKAREVARRAWVARAPTPP
jgi:hypothetical protein